MKAFISNFVTLAVFAFAVFVYFFNLMPNVERLSADISSLPWLAAVVGLSLFVVKCLSPIIPMGVIYMLCGYLLSPWAALAVCNVGNALCFSFSYYEGYNKNAQSPALISALSYNSKRGFFPAFFLHCIRFFPCHTAGVYLGAARLPFWEYLFGSVLGALPTVLLSISIASSFTTPTPRIWIGIAAVTATTILGMVFIKYQNR